MRIVRPHGSSRSLIGDDGRRRVLVDRESGAERDLPDFARSHDKLVVAQWISTIDKIARKPAGTFAASPAQQAFRQRLGEACWRRLVERRRLPAVERGDDKRTEELRDLWWFKIHPYAANRRQPKAEPRLQGRWYETLVGKMAPEVADVGVIAERIEAHLYEGEYRIGLASNRRREGKIATRAESIRDNVLHPTSEVSSAWTIADKVEYIKLRDPVAAIHREAADVERKGGHVDLTVAAAVLSRHYREVFFDPGAATIMGITKAREERPGMFALHEQLKQCYRRLLKRTRKDTKDHRKHHPAGPRLSTLLPPTIDDALRLSGRQNENADCNRLVRLGRIVHYSALGRAQDSTAPLTTGWPEAIDDSFFWTSDGQSEIKRAEAFVRVWRQGLVLAGQTLRDWTSFKGDMLGDARSLNEALSPGAFLRSRFDRKLGLLFGDRVGLLDLKSDADCLAFLRGLSEGATTLRHAVFHFGSRERLVERLEGLPGRLAGPVGQMASALWREDARARAELSKAELRGVHVEVFLEHGQVERLYRLLTEAGPTELPLPRFARMLMRAKDAWGRDRSVGLPEPANRAALEAPDRLCQYTVLKLLYERPFRMWLVGQGTTVIAGWIERAIQRASRAAKSLNAKGNELAERVIVAKAENLPILPPDGDILRFFYDLSAATAAEMRVQRGYESDGEKAREQAEFIDNLLRDVVVLAFRAFLRERDMEWTLTISADRQKPSSPARLDDLETATAPAAEPWQAAFYLLLHLLPVEAVGPLLHQLFKWNVLARSEALSLADKDAVRKLIETMTLYLDMHDAKFVRGAALVGCDAFGFLFQTKDVFDRVFPLEQDREAERRTPRRGLREINRFGHEWLIEAMGAGRKINDAMVRRVQDWEKPKDDGLSAVARAQQRREALHDKWVTNKRVLAAEDLEFYCQIVSDISYHRRESNFIHLFDHVRAYRTVLSVLGRLVDYAGLFERDVYFVTLALIHLEGLKPQDVFSQRGVDLLHRGQIIFALRKATGGSSGRVLDKLAKHFSRVWEKGNPLARTRNALAHLNMLQEGAPPLHLTDWINRTRRLLSYDRKLKNAVSKSVIELMARAGVELRWSMNVEHDLTDASLGSNQAAHLASAHLVVPSAWPDRVPLSEPLHSDGYVRMVAAAFGGTARPSRSILDDLLKVDWKASAEGRRPGQQKRREVSEQSRPEYR